MRSNREIINFLFAVWFVHQWLPEIQAQADSTSSSKGKLASSNLQFPQDQEVSSSNHRDGKVVLSEEQNQHCFKPSIVGEGENDGDLFTRYCYPGYRRSGENETCSGPHGCCHCAQGTYMPQPNDCRHCIMKIFCHDYGLEYEDYGSAINNSKCGAQMQTQQDDHTSPSTTSLVAVPSHHTTDSLSSRSTNDTVQNSTNFVKAGISVLEHWMTEGTFILAIVTVILVGLLVLTVLIGLICFGCFCIFGGKRARERKFARSCYELNEGQRSNDDSSEAVKLTDGTFEDGACTDSVQEYL